MAVLYIFLAILVLLLMITIHEFGHYLAGVILKFKINEFAVGFGPVIAIPRFWDKEAMARIKARKTAARAEEYVAPPPKEINGDYLFRLQVQNKRGENISLRWFPLGGFCAFAGEDKSKGDAPYLAQKAWKRLIVQVAGPLFNILSAFLFCMLLIGVLGYGVPKVAGDSMDATKTQFEKGDVIVAVEGQEITALDSYAALMQKVYADSSGKYTLGADYRITVERKKDGGVFRQDILGKFQSMVVKEKDGKPKEDDKGIVVTEVRIGIEIEQYLTRRHGFWRSIGMSFPYTFRMAGELLKEFGRLFTGKSPISNLGGPVTTIVSIGSVISENIRYILVLLPFIAINLGVFNLMPIPSLDGARIVFTLIEMIFRKPVPRKIEAHIHTVGIIALLALVIIIDVMHLLL